MSDKDRFEDLTSSQRQSSRMNCSNDSFGDLLDDINNNIKKYEGQKELDMLKISNNQLDSKSTINIVVSDQEDQEETGFKNNKSKQQPTTANNVQSVHQKQKSKIKIPQNPQFKTTFSNILSQSVISGSNSQIKKSKRNNESISIKGSLIQKSLVIDSEKIHFKINIVGKKKVKIIPQPRLIASQSFQSSISEIGVSQKEEIQQLQTIEIEDLLNKQSAWGQLDKINQLDPTNQTTFMIYREILNSPTSLDQQMERQEVRNKIKQKSQQNQNSIYTIILVLQAYLKSISDKFNIVFCSKSTLKSQLSLKVISTGFALQKYRCQQIITKGGAGVDFKQISEDQQEFQKFQQWYQRHLLKKYKIQSSNIKIVSILKLKKNAIAIEWDTYQPQIVLQNELASQKIKVVPYFTSFYLCQEDFDKKNGNIKFAQFKDKILFRGNWPYYQPIKCIRRSIKVWNKFDQNNNEWLSMENLPNQWPSSFFGLRNSELKMKRLNLGEKQFVKKQQRVLQHPLINQNKNQQLLTSQLKSTLKVKKSVNTNQTVEQGIFSTPHLWNAIQDAHPIQLNKQDYILIFQCRLNPKKIKITQKQDYWVINKPSDIRPYGIMLLKQDYKQTYPTPQVQFKQRFTYQKYKQRIQKGQKQ